MVEISAPGVNILSASMGGGYHGLNGTSMASPHVAGVAALVIASGVTSNVDVRARLVDTANDLGALGHDPLYGFGLVDAAEAACNVSPPNSAPTVTLTEPVGAASFDSTSVITFTGTASDPEDGDLTSALQWTSDIDGPLGSSGTLNVTLSEAVHTVRATVTDSGGASSSESVQVTVSPLGRKDEPRAHRLAPEQRLAQDEEPRVSRAPPERESRARRSQWPRATERPWPSSRWLGRFGIRPLAVPLSARDGRIKSMISSALPRSSLALMTMRGMRSRNRSVPAQSLLPVFMSYDNKTGPDSAKSSRKLTIGSPAARPSTMRPSVGTFSPGLTNPVLGDGDV